MTSEATEAYGRILQLEEEINRIIGEIEVSPAAGEKIRFRDIRNVEKIPRSLPGSTLLFSYPAVVSEVTGGGVENEWRWIQRSYFDNTDQDKGQRTMKILIPELIAAFSRNRTIEIPDEDAPEGVKVATVRVADTGPPQPGSMERTRVFVKSLEVIINIEEWD